MNKVTFLINSLSTSGAEKVLSVIVTELVKQKYKVEVIFLEKNEFYSLPNEVKKTYLSSFNGSESGIKKLFYIPVLAFRLKKYIQKNNIKLIQSHFYRSNYINVIAKILGAKHVVQIVNAGRISRYLEQGILGKINLFLIKKLYGHADLIILKAKGMQEDMQNLFQFKNQQIVINNPFDIEQIKILMEEKISDFHFDKSKKYLISVGRLIPLKRNHEIIENLPRLPKNCEIIFLDSVPEKQRLLEIARKLHLEKSVHFLGQVTNPYKYLAKSDIFVSCSESEGFPNVLVEAMICGTPIVSSDCVSGPRKILAPNKENEFGFLFNVGDTDKMVEHINFLLNNPKIREQYIINAKLRANDFSLKNIIDKYKKVLENE